MVSYSTQNYSSLKNSTWPHLLLVGQLGQTWSNLLKTCIILYGSLQPSSCYSCRSGLSFKSKIHQEDKLLGMAGQCGGSPQKMW